MRKLKQRWHLEFSKLLAVLFLAALLPAASIQAASAQDYAGPSFSGSDSGSANVPGMVGGNSAGAGYTHSAPNSWGGRSGSAQAANMGQSPAPSIGFAMGHSGYGANGGNNGSQTAIKLPAANCCGKTTRNTNYYANDYMGLSDNSMANARGNSGFGLNSAPGMGTMGGAGFASSQNGMNIHANSRSMMQIRSAGAAGRGGNSIPGQMFVPGQAPGQVSVPGQMPGSF